MNPAIENLITRRSIRKFKSDPVPKDLIRQIIEAGLYAPSGRNYQSTIIIAVTNQELRNKISKINCRIGGWKDDFDPFYGAPVILIVLANREYPNYIYDGSLTMGNILNAAHSLGLGSCWIHRAKQEFDMPEFQEILRSLSIEGNFEGIGHCALGYADEKLPSPPRRKENRVFYLD
jgi:hypothetical protein